jgi:hypothetical protein
MVICLVIARRAVRPDVCAAVEVGSAALASLAGFAGRGGTSGSTRPGRCAGHAWRQAGVLGQDATRPWRLRGGVARRASGGG